MTTRNAYIIENQPDHIYRAFDAITQSTLKKYHEVTPEEGRYAELNPTKPSREMLIGTVVSDHLAFEQTNVVILPSGHGNSKAVQEAKKAAGKRALKQSDFDLALHLVQRLREDPQSRDIIEGATHRELSIYAKLGRREAVCKGRVDLYDQELALLSDVKTTSEQLSDRVLKSYIPSWNYHAQLAWYRLLLRAAGLPVDHCFLIFVRTEAPHQVRSIRLEDVDVQAGEELMLGLLETYCLCRENNSWPGYGSKFGSFLLADWARK